MIRVPVCHLARDTLFTLALLMGIGGCASPYEYLHVSTVPEEPVTAIDGDWESTVIKEDKRTTVRLKGGYLFCPEKTRLNGVVPPGAVYAMDIRDVVGCAYACQGGVLMKDSKEIYYLPSSMHLRSDGYLEIRTAAQKVGDTTMNADVVSVFAPRTPEFLESVRTHYSRAESSSWDKAIDDPGTDGLRSYLEGFVDGPRAEEIRSLLEQRAWAACSGERTMEALAQYVSLSKSGDIAGLHKEEAELRLQEGLLEEAARRWARQQAEVAARNDASMGKLKAYQLAVLTESEFLADGWDTLHPYGQIGVTSIRRESGTSIYEIGQLPEPDPSARYLFINLHSSFMKQRDNFEINPEYEADVGDTGGAEAAQELLPKVVVCELVFLDGLLDSVRWHDGVRP